VKTILLFVPNLFFSTQVEETARRMGYNVESISGDADFDAVIAQKHPALVLLTFERTGEAWQNLASAARRAGVKILAFGSHMNVAAFKRAKELGCDEVVANSRLSAELPMLLEKWASK
jgi:NAD(P)H-dependent flavin oxidoreductase YrpB (nitropropane dioxygenase family)